MSRTCALCRKRELECDGLQPTCTSCSEFGTASPCDYSSRASSNSKSSLLQKGAACLPCRRKKKKCDAKRPCCTTCKVAHKQSHCIYEEDAQRNLIQSLVARTRELEERLASNDQFPQDECAMLDPTHIPEGVGAQHPPVVNVTNVPFASVPYWTPPFAHPPSADTQPRTTLEHFRHLGSYRTCFSAHLGFRFSADAQNTVSSAELGNTRIHPALIHAAQLIGCTVYQEINPGESFATVETLELEATRCSLTESVNPLVTLQVHNVLAIYYFVRHRYCEGTEQVRVASELVHRHNLRFCTPHVDSWDVLQEPPQEIEELLCALSHLLYMNIDRYIVLGIPSDLGMDYEQEFRSVPIMYPSLSRSHLSILRARSSLLYHLARQLSSRLGKLPSSPWDSYPTTERSNSVSVWMAEYWSLLEEVEGILAILNPAILKASLQPHQRMASHGLKVCLIVTLTAAVELHHLAPRTHAESRENCLNAALRLVGVGKTLTADDYQMLDPILGVCWLTAAKVTFEESAEPTDGLSAMNWATARAVLLGLVPILVKSFPYLDVSLNQLLLKAGVSAALPA